MRILRCLLWWGFAFEALTFTVGSVEVFYNLALFSVKNTHAHMLTLEIGAVYMFVVGVMAGLAAWRMKHADAFSKAAGLTASIMNLLLFPIGTALGVAGLCYFLRNPAPVAALEKKHTPVPGDGTNKWSGVLSGAVQIAWLWVVYGYIRRKAIGMGMQPGHWSTNDLLITGFAIYFSILIHEVGHLLAGAAAGFQLMAFRVGFLSWHYQGGRWRFKRAGWMGGHTAMVPRTPDNIRQRAMFLMFGGPLGSAVLCVVGYALMLMAGASGWIDTAGPFLILITAFGSADFIGNLIPLASGVGYSDGARLWQLYRKGPWADYLCATFYFGLSRTTRMRPRDWPREMVEHAAAFGGSLPSDPDGMTMAYVHFEDCGEVERAAHYLERINAKVTPGSERALVMAVERAYFEAFYHRDGLEGGRWLAQAPEKPDSVDYWRSLAAVLAAQGDLHGAEEAWDKGWALASMLPEVGVYEPDRRQLQMIGERLRVERLKEEPVMEAVPA